MPNLSRRQASRQTGANLWHSRLWCRQQHHYHCQRHCVIKRDVQQPESQMSLRINELIAVPIAVYRQHNHSPTHICVSVPCTYVCGACNTKALACKLNCDFTCLNDSVCPRVHLSQVHGTSCWKLHSCKAIGLSSSSGHTFTNTFTGQPHGPHNCRMATELWIYGMHLFCTPRFD